MENGKNSIRILKIEPGKEPYVKEISNGLDASQSEVEGLIDCMTFLDGCIAVVNDEGKLNGMEANRWYMDDIICGPFFICGSGEDGDFISLTEEQIGWYSRQFAEIPVFTGTEPEMQPRMEVYTF
jgi:hypothetical protein